MGCLQSIIILYCVLILAKAIYPSFQDGYINHVKPHVSWSYASILGIGTPFWWSNPHLVVKPSLLNGWTPISYWWSTTVSKSAVRPSTKAIAVFMFAACQCTSTIEDEVSGLSTTCQIRIRPVREVSRLESHSDRNICKNHSSTLEGMIEGSLEVKLPTIWTDEKQSTEEAERRERLEERREKE